MARVVARRARQRRERHASGAGAGGAASARVDAAVCRALAGAPRVVLAVSGGRDSMVLLDAAARVSPGQVVCVATFDHGTGAAATRAAALVARRAAELRLPVRVGRWNDPGDRSRTEGTEAAWRAARWRFLSRLAEEHRASVATAHTRDDQLETVLMRAIRGAGARGLAALHAEGPVLRPLLELSRREVALAAAERGVVWEDDPSNRSRRHLRNRIRLDILPALLRARPELEEELLALARESAALRRRVERILGDTVCARVRERTLTVAGTDMRYYDAPALRLLWPALAARAGVVLDRRGTERLSEFTIKGKPGSRIQLSGGFEAVWHRGDVLVRRAAVSDEMLAPVALDGEVVLGRWRFQRVDRAAGRPDPGHDAWTAALPTGRALLVRPWKPGDRMTPHGAPAPRRVKGLLRDAGIDGASRAGWPVVLAGDEIVWIPGVRRSSAATVRSGRPVVLYHCEPIDR